MKKELEVLNYLQEKIGLDKFYTASIYIHNQVKLQGYAKEETLALLSQTEFDFEIKYLPKERWLSCTSVYNDVQIDITLTF
jgi:hypothetical protein